VLGSLLSTGTIQASTRVAETRIIVVTILCLASFYKGAKLIEELHAQGCKVVLVCTQKVYDEPWPLDCIHERFALPDIAPGEELMKAVGYLFRGRDFKAIIPLDEYTVDSSAWLREHFRLPGRSISDAAFYRDKLLMRIAARNAGLPVPGFVLVGNHAAIDEFTRAVPAPWILKPRAESGSVKMKKLHNVEELWEAVHELNDEQSHYLIEQFIPGHILHIDSLVWDSKIVFSGAHRYGRPPFNIWHEGGVFTSRTIPPKSKTYKHAVQQNKDLVAALGMKTGVTHAEFIEAEDGTIYFLEVAARVGGAHIDALVLETRGVDLWREWGKIEVAQASGGSYKVKASKDLQGGLLVCLAKQERPDLSRYDDPEVSWKTVWDYHCAMVVVSPDTDRVDQLLEQYQWRFAEDFLAVAPPADHPA
jgi:hypothetical protein